MVSCIVLAAGAGRRMQLDANKMFLTIGRYSVLQWTLIALSRASSIDEVIIVVASGEEDVVSTEVEALSLPFVVRYTVGGKERQDSVKAGMRAVHPSCDIVLIHDGARPLVSEDLINRVIAGAKEYGAVVPGVPVTDTIKRIQDAQTVQETLPRHELVAVQTPQGFQKEVFEEAQRFAEESGYIGTDDVSLVEAMGGTVHIVEGSYDNYKITTPHDVEKVRQQLGVKSPMMRVGYGYDVHRFAEGRPCILGGVHIDSPIGPDGHSDADVLVHALMDALLGAAGLRDIGYYFPPSDDQWKGISSITLLEHVVTLLKEKHVTPYNVDVMVIAEAPKLQPHIPAMKENIAATLGIPTERISIKATTNEGLGALGRKEGIAAQAVVTLYEGEVI